jgi:hypothetical protein
MEERNEISVELSAISALVGGISRQIPYGIPVGYFDQLPATVMSRVGGSSSIARGSSILPAQSPSFQVPDGYFDGFAAQVLARIKGGATAGDELPAIFNRISRVTPYQIPEGYWEELSPLLAVLRDKPAYAVPEGYFNELSPVLTVAHEGSTYRVPEGYFGALVGQILEKIAPARVIPMERVATGKVLKGNWWKYSSVASIAACLLLIFSWPQVDNKKGGGAMPPDITQALQKVSDKEMQAYLDDQHTLLTDPVGTSTATLDMNEGEVKSLLGEVTDNDLQQYMEEHGKADDLATN